MRKITREVLASDASDWHLRCCPAFLHLVKPQHMTTCFICRCVRLLLSFALFRTLTHTGIPAGLRICCSCACWRASKVGEKTRHFRNHTSRSTVRPYSRSSCQSQMQCEEINHKIVWAGTDALHLFSFSGCESAYAESRRPMATMHDTCTFETVSEDHLFSIQHVERNLTRDI